MVRGIFMRNSRKKRIIVHKAASLVIAFLCILLAYFIVFWSLKISHNLDSIAEMKAKQIVTRTVNEAIREKLYEETYAQNLLVMETGTDGSIEMVQANTQAINQLLSGLSYELQQKYKSGAMEQNTSVPLGSLLGSRILSQLGPSIKLTIMPSAVSHMDFITEFETQGINQTKYKVYAVVNTEARVLAPFSTDRIEVENTVLIAEAIILGDVPNSFVNVPENEILDGMDQ